MPLSSLIGAEALRLGFAAVGFASVGPCQTFDRFNAWLGRGFAGDMIYLAKYAALRADPRQVMPEAHSLIVVAARYPADQQIAPFSNYCRGRDYHDVLRVKLQQLASGLAAQSRVPLSARICVDSAPVLEREWAVRAGLGWIGRQGSLVNPEWGCTLFLGELLVNLDLTPSTPMPNKCGQCRRCVEACPTGAIQPDGLIDARRCIAGLTIEYNGKIPGDLQPLMGVSIFGCDRCTAVCPYNRSGTAAILPEFNPIGATMPTARECLAMSEADFQRRFRGTVVYRSGLTRLKRNALIAMQQDEGGRQKSDGV